MSEPDVRFSGHEADGVVDIIVDGELGGRLVLDLPVDGRWLCTSWGHWLGSALVRVAGLHDQELSRDLPTAEDFVRAKVLVAAKREREMRRRELT